MFPYIFFWEVQPVVHYHFILKHLYWSVFDWSDNFTRDIQSMLEKIEQAIKNGQSRETGNKWVIINSMITLSHYKIQHNFLLLIIKNLPCVLMVPKTKCNFWFRFCLSMYFLTHFNVQRATQSVAYPLA